MNFNQEHSDFKEGKFTMLNVFLVKIISLANFV